MVMVPHPDQTPGLRYFPEGYITVLSTMPVDRNIDPVAEREAALQQALESGVVHRGEIPVVYNQETRVGWERKNGTWRSSAISLKDPQLSAKSAVSAVFHRDVERISMAAMYMDHPPHSLTPEERVELAEDMNRVEVTELTESTQKEIEPVLERLAEHIAREMYEKQIDHAKSARDHERETSMSGNKESMVPAIDPVTQWARQAKAATTEDLRGMQRIVDQEMRRRDLEHVAAKPLHPTLGREMSESEISRAVEKIDNGVAHSRAKPEIAM